MTFTKFNVATSASASASANKIYFLSKSRPRILISEPILTWFEEVKQRLEYLIRLEQGWDGYKGLSVSFDNAYFAMQMLESICGTETPAPQIVPGVAGDLQIEWHTLKGDIELHVKAPNEVDAWILETDGDETGVERSLTTDFTEIATWVTKITEASIAAEAAAA